jgi:hypothetical protein
MSFDSVDAASGRKTAPVYMFWDSELVLNAPPQAIWPYLVNYPSWQSYSKVERIFGRAGEVGEVVKLIKEEKGFVFPAYYARTIKIEPGYRIVWKTFLEKGTTEIDRFGIVDFRLYEGKAEGETRFVDHLMYEFLVPYEKESELDEFRKRQDENFHNLFAATRPKLKKLVEGGA